MDNAKIFLSVIIPAYNEEKRILKSLQNINQFLLAQKYSSEIIIVDDGSKDKTVTLVNDSKIPNVRVIGYGSNKGKGYAVNYGVSHALGRYILFCDADNATPFEQITELLKYAEKFPVVIGSRYLAGSKIEIKQPLNRIIGARLGNLLIQLLILPGIVDTQCGFKLFEAKCAHQIFGMQTTWRWAFDMEILVLARQLGFKIKQVPVRWIDQAGSTVQGAAFRKTLIELLNIRWSTWTKPAKSRIT